MSDIFEMIQKHALIAATQTVLDGEAYVNSVNRERRLLEEIKSAYAAEIEAAEKRGAVRIWREGYQRGVLDGTFDLDPADNPYRGGDSL